MLSAALSVVALLGAGASLAATPAQAAPTPWWHLQTSTRPAIVPSGGVGTIVAQAQNLGDAPTSGPVTISLALPAGASFVESEGVPQISLFPFRAPAVDFGPAGLFDRLEILKLCTTTPDQVTCTFHEEAGLIGEEEGDFAPADFAPYEYLELRASVEVSGPAGGVYTVEAGGGSARSVNTSRPLLSGAGDPVFGSEDLSLVPEEAGGAIDTRAGSHPFQLTTTFNLNQTVDAAKPPALPKDLHFKLPPGQLGNATILPQCSAAAFTTSSGGGGRNLCPADSVLGAAILTFYEPVTLHLQSAPVPIFNLEPKPGEPARFGFEAEETPVILDTSVRSAAGEALGGGPEPDYGVTVSVSNITQISNLISSTVTFWGVPGDPRHDASRGWDCIADRFWNREGGCVAANAEKPPAFLTMPTDCAAPYAASVEGISWTDPTHPQPSVLVPETYSLAENSGEPLALTGCNQLPFSPTTKAEPTSDAATSPTGLNFDIDVEDPGLESAEGLAQSQLKKAVVTLPEGFTTNPSVAEGLKACSEAEYDAATVESGTGCLQESKIGEVEIESPLVEPLIHGSIYVARQTQNPNHNLLTIYMIARNAEVGVLVKQALKVVPNPVTGQLTTEVDNVPELPFSRFHLSFRQGQRSPLVTPPTCGPYTVNADLYPWSNPAAAVHRESSFQITQGPEGQPCPNGTPPFHPTLLAGSENPTAGVYSPFYTDITRKDSEQEITRFSIKLPTGMIAKLKGVSECSDAQVAAAKAREREGGGGEEEAAPSCPSGTLIGHTDVGTGVGNVLAYAPGKLYLAGPYHGSPISLVSITAAKVGPFDLGTVVVRFALDVNHETAEVSVDGANSDPIPHIVDGIPVHLRDIQAFVDRPGFTLNPTSCAKKSTAATVLGSGANFASSSDDVPVTVSSSFQVGNCASLGFAPKLALNLVGKKTHRGALPAFKAVLTYPTKGTYANIAAAQVTLPESEYLEQGHLKDVCTRKVFETGATPGENCPAKSIYGHARATTPLLDAPLEGPVYLRTGYGTKLPELAAALNGPQISITLAGKIDSVHKKGTEGSRIRNTFSVVPDAPVERFVLELKGGKKGLLVNSTDVCKGTHKALAAFTGQNGKLDEYEPALKAQCGKGGGKKTKKSKGAKKKAGH
jgi:hypothetical protein